MHIYIHSFVMPNWSYIVCSKRLLINSSRKLQKKMDLMHCNLWYFLWLQPKEDSIETRIKYLVSFYYPTIARDLKRSTYYGNMAVSQSFSSHLAWTRHFELSYFFWGDSNRHFENLPNSKSKTYYDFSFLKHATVWNLSILK